MATSQIEDGAADLEQVSSQVTFDILYGCLTKLFMLQVRFNEKVILGVDKQAVQVSLVILCW